MPRSGRSRKSIVLPCLSTMPLALDRDVGLVDSPGGPNRFGEPSPPLLVLRYVAGYPSKDCRVGDLDAALGHHLHEVAIGKPIRNVPYAELDNVSIEGPLAVHRVTSDRLRHPAPLTIRGRQSNQCPPLHQNRRNFAEDAPPIKSMPYGLQKYQFGTFDTQCTSRPNG